MSQPTNRPGAVEKAAFLGGVAGTSLMAGAAGFLLLYMTDAVGVGAAAVGTLLLVAKIADGVIDPVIGYFVDHLPVTRWGRFRLYVLIGGALTAACLVALFAAPALLPSALAAAWVVYLLWGVIVGLLQIPMTSLLPAVTEDAKTRSQLAGIIAFTGLLAAAASTGLTVPLVRAFGDGVNGWLIYAIVVAATGFLLVALMSIRVRERVIPLSPERYRLSDVRRVFFSGRAVPILLTAKVTVQSASGALLAAMPFFFLYYVGDAAMLSAAAVVMALPMVGGAVLGPRLARQAGTKPYFVASIGAAVAGLLGLFVVPPSPVPVLACFAVIGVGFGGAVALNYLLLAELTDYIEWQHGVRAEASLAAMVSFATKAGSGLGAGLVAYMLALTGYREGGVAQNAEAIHGVVLAQSVVPAGIGLLGALVFLAYPITAGVAAQASAGLAESRASAVEPGWRGQGQRREERQSPICST